MITHCGFKRKMRETNYPLSLTLKERKKFYDDIPGTHIIVPIIGNGSEPCSYYESQDEW
jgi:hypothetical protein